MHDNKFNDPNISNWLSLLFDPNISSQLKVLSIYNNNNLRGSIPIIPRNSSIESFFAHNVTQIKK